MTLALYDPGRFDRSPASIFSTSSLTSNADLRLSTVRIENQVSVLDIRSAMRMKAERHRACFAAVLDRCYSRIRRCASVMREECTFEVPLFLPGLPVYDVEKCVRFVASHLSKNGFRVERVPDEDKDEGRMLIISWSTRDPNDDPPHPPMAYRPLPKIKNEDAMIPAWNPRYQPPNLSTAAPKAPTPNFGSAFAPLVPPERLLQPASDFSPPPFGSLPLAVGTRLTSSHDLKEPRIRRPAKSISEFRPNSKFALN